MWLPPACKGGSPRDNGFGIYGICYLVRAALLILDLWDLGEFNQKGSRRTKWGTIEELKDLTQVAERQEIDLYFHAVLNHKAYADETERCLAIQCSENGIFPRLEPNSDE